MIWTTETLTLVPSNWLAALANRVAGQRLSLMVSSLPFGLVYVCFSGVIQASGTKSVRIICV